MGSNAVAGNGGAGGNGRDDGSWRQRATKPRGRRSKVPRRGPGVAELEKIIREQQQQGVDRGLNTQSQNGYSYNPSRPSNSFPVPPMTQPLLNPMTPGSTSSLNCWGLQNLYTPSPPLTPTSDNSSFMGGSGSNRGGGGTPTVGVGCFPNIGSFETPFQGLPQMVEMRQPQLLLTSSQPTFHHQTPLNLGLGQTLSRDPVLGVGLKVNSENGNRGYEALDGQFQTFVPPANAPQQTQAPKREVTQLDLFPLESCDLKGSAKRGNPSPIAFHNFLEIRGEDMGQKEATSFELNNEKQGEDKDGIDLNLKL